MIKTSRQVQGDVRQLLLNSNLASALSGGVYRSGTRPRDSKLEDAVIHFTAGLSEQVQTGIVTLNIFVPDIDPEENGTLVEDIARTEAIERLAAQWVEGLNKRSLYYHFSLAQAIHTTAEPSIAQHFVVVKLKYKYFDKLYYSI